uniref:Metallo-beta-lactamase domain-containing protein n=1 Tax=Alexandrium catenella TaxID=2925 RepID=A0A7S1SD01_ALECA
MANYCYLVVNTHDRTAIAIDAAWDVVGLYKLADKLGVKVKGSIYTHYHFDHCGGEVNPMFTQGRKVCLQGAKDIENRGGQVWAGKGDEQMIKDQCSLANTVEALEDGAALDCGDLVLHIVRTPGHTPGSICVFAAPQCLSPRAGLGKTPLLEQTTKAEAGMLITGDTLFVGSCGRTDFPGSSQEQMFASLSRLSKMNPEVLVLPGHGYSPEPFTTIGKERASNQMVQMGMQLNPKPPPLPPCAACDGTGKCGPKGFVIGRKVRIQGLTSEAGKTLNRRQGVVQRYDSSKERYQVLMLAATEVKLLKPDNLDSARAPEQEAAPAPPPAPDVD